MALFGNFRGPPGATASFCFFCPSCAPFFLAAPSCRLLFLNARALPAKEAMCGPLPCPTNSVEARLASPEATTALSVFGFSTHICTNTISRKTCQVKNESPDVDVHSSLELRRVIESICSPTSNAKYIPSPKPAAQSWNAGCTLFSTLAAGLRTLSEYGRNWGRQGKIQIAPEVRKKPPLVSSLGPDRVRGTGRRPGRAIRAW